MEKIIMVTFFGYVIIMMSLNWFFNVRFRYNQLEKHNLAKSRNFSSPTSKVTEGLGAESL